MQSARLPLILLIVALVLGCANTSTEYIVVGVSPSRLSKTDAQSLLVQNYLQAQINQKLDEPLTAKTIVLPPYPQDLINTKVVGNVRVRFVVDETGKVIDPTVVGSAVSDLASLSIQSVQQWVFKPIRQNGRPIRLMLNYEFIFRVE